MKKRIMSLFLAISMIYSCSNFVFAEDSNDMGFSEVQEENFEQNDILTELDDSYLVDDELDANEKQIFSEPTESIENEEEVLVDSNEDLEGVEEPSDEIEETTPEGIEPITEEETEGVENENEGQGEEDYIVIEQPDISDEELEEPIVLPTPDEELDPNFTIPAEEEELGQIIPTQPEIMAPEVIVPEVREPQTFYVEVPLALYGQMGFLQAFFTYANMTGVDAELVGIEINPLNGWNLVDEDVNFKEYLVNQKDFRFSFNKEVVDRPGYYALRNPITLNEGDYTNISLLIETGPFKDSFLDEEFFSFRLVLEEIVDDVIVEQVEQIEQKQEMPKIPTVAPVLPTLPTNPPIVETSTDETTEAPAEVEDVENIDTSKDNADIAEDSQIDYDSVNYDELTDTAQYEEESVESEETEQVEESEPSEDRGVIENNENADPVEDEGSAETVEDEPIEDVIEDSPSEVMVLNYFDDSSECEIESLDIPESPAERPIEVYSEPPKEKDEVVKIVEKGEKTTKTTLVFPNGEVVSVVVENR